MSVDYEVLLCEWSLNYRSFSHFQKKLEAEGCRRELLEGFARVLIEYQLMEEGAKGRLSRRFFEKYGCVLADCSGCSCPVPDHRRVKVPLAYLFVSVLGALHGLKCFEGSVVNLARAVDSVFQTGYTLDALERKIRVGSWVSDEILSSLEKLKSRKKWPKKGVKSPFKEKEF